MRINELTQTRSVLGESPMWEVDSNRLFWVDSLGRKIFRAAPDGSDLLEFLQLVDYPRRHDQPIGCSPALPLLYCRFGGLYVARVYNWTEDEDEIAPDAVTVGIRSDTRMLTIAGLQFGQREATLYWPDWPGRSEPVKAALEGPMPVEDALARAEKLYSRYAFKRVVIWLQHRELWDDRWGSLADQPGI